MNRNETKKFMKKLCENCLKEVSCTYHEREKKLRVENKEIKFKEKYYICEECHNEFYDDLYDENIKEGNKEIRKLNGIITIDEINEITTKYNIGKKPLSLVLGLGEITITRYLDGQNPTKENSDLLKNVLNNPLLYEMYLEVNKDKITEIAYKKSLGKTKQIELIENKSKIYSVTLYIINKIKEIDTLAIQKILYFLDGMSPLFLDNWLLDTQPEAWKYGPVYKEIYECLSYYGYKKIDYNELLKEKTIDLEEKEKLYIDTVLESFACYSSAILREMTHLTDPWINARVGLNENDSSNRIISHDDIGEYFNKIAIEYNIKNLCDIEKYCNSLFEKSKDILFNKMYIDN